MVEGLHNSSSQARNLLITVGDAGIGIAQSLKENPKYKNKSAAYLLLHAFISKVTSSVQQRGKGLADVLALTRARRAWLRVNSQGQDAVFDFSNTQNPLTLHTPKNNVLPTHKGTSFAILLPDVPDEQLGPLNPKQTDAQIAAYQKEQALWMF